jgi:hypothetical protein
MNIRSRVIRIGIALTAVAAIPAAASAETRQIPAAGTAAFRGADLGPDSIQSPELRRGGRAEGAEGDVANRGRPEFDGKRVFPRRPLDAPVVRSSQLAGANPEVTLSVAGLNHRQQRLANGGNQFSLEPPDQALCVGNGFVVESVNSVLRVHSTADGAPLTGVQDLNTFFGYPAAINRTTGTIGPNVIDPICHYDPESNRFVVVITTLHVDPAGDFNGRNTIDLAVSNSGDPTGTWTIYSVPAQNDGTEGTPNHGCTLDGTAPGPCFQDYPHIGADANGIYVTTNEYDLFGPNYSAGQIFAFSKQQLAAHPAAVDVTLVENLEVAGTPGFTVWPATSPAGQYSSEAGGTEFFLSTIAGDGSETGNPTGTARKIGVWALANTRSLNSASPDLRISSRLIPAAKYVFPPTAAQKTGSTPLGDCLNDTTTVTPFGTGCWNLFFLPADEPAHDEVQSGLDSGDTRMQQTWFVNGRLWGTAGTTVKVGGELKTGIVWYEVNPRVDRNGRVQGSVVRDGYLALADNNLVMPAIAMGTNGRGAIAFTVAGEDHFPSAGYATITSRGSVGPIHVAAPGIGPQDGFSGYKAFGDPPRPRWGDYGAAVTDGDSIWLASEYIAQTCTLAQYLTAPIGSCSGTRTSLANWGTRLTKLF